MICVVLAAGYATRLYPLTENFPKPLLPISGKPILNWLLDDIDCQPEVTGYVVISNHRFITHFETWAAEQNYSHPITLVDDGSIDNDHRLGAVKDVQFAMERVGITEDMLMIAGDNILDFSFGEFLRFASGKGTSCVMCHEENELEKQRKTAIITRNENDLITSYEEKPKHPKGNLAVPPFYYYRAGDAARIPEAIADGCDTDAPGSFAAWLSRQVPVHAWKMSGKRYDIGDIQSYKYVQEVFGRK